MNGFKVIALLRKRDGMSADAFRDYYESRHVPLVRSLFPTITGYRRNFVDLAGLIREVGAGPLDFDVVTEIWFADRAGYDEMLRLHSQTDAGTRIAADEENFLDRSRTRLFIVDEAISL